MDQVLRRIQNYEQLSPYMLAWKLSIPVHLVYFPLGIFFGIIFTKYNFPWYYAPLMSAMVYGGAVQFIALGILAVGGSLFELLLGTFLVAARNSFYGLSLLNRCPKHWLHKHYFIFCLVDATYALFTTVPTLEADRELKFLLSVNIMIHVNWIVGTFLGAYFGPLLPQMAGLEFILTCFFTVMVIEHILTYKTAKPILIAFTSTLLAFWLTPEIWLLSALTLSIIMITGLAIRNQQV